MLAGRVDFSSLFISLNGVHYDSLAQAKAAGAPTVNYGVFLNQVLNFLIVALAVFLLVRLVNRLDRKAAAPAPTTRDCPQCLLAIPVLAKRCGHCTSALTV
jgi:large conductance mechanosensitive channel